MSIRQALFLHRLQDLLSTITSLSLILFFAGCATDRLKNHSKPFIRDEISTSQPSATTRDSLPTSLSIHSELDSTQEAEENSSLSSSLPDHSSHLESSKEFQIEPNSYIQKWIQYFSQKDHSRFQLFLDRGAEYREVVENLLQENGLPPQLYYLAMIESGYSTKATSIAKAAGVWQFIPATAKRYGLEVNSYTDERRDPIRATEAAGRYLKDLYNVFGSWHLALAAYNAGEYRILGAVLKGKSRNFWSLIQSGVLPSETADYIPKFLAAMMIGENPSAYGFREPQTGIKYPDLKAIEVPAAIRLKDIAKHLNIALEDLVRFNPNIRKSITPPRYKTYEIWIPEAQLPQSSELIPQLTQYQQRTNISSAELISSTDSEPERNRHYYQVQPGDTLKKIAKKYKVSTQYLKKINHLRSSQITAGSRIRIHSNQYQAQSLIRYRVKKGDRLTQIAKRFGVSVQEILSLNVLQKNKLNVGQTLRIRPPQNT